MTDKQIITKENVTYGHKLLTGKQTKYEFVKQDFEKDIDVPSKQIIIDGVDVSECKHFEDEECLNPSETVANCEASPNCNYKQLKRKEQECEELKKVNDEKNELLAKLGCPTIATARMKALTLQQQFDQLKQALQEIKEIAESVASWGSKCKICELNKNCADCLDDNMQTILQKISEVEDV